MNEFKAKSGATVVIGIAPWQNAKALKQAIQNQAAAAGLKLDLEADISSLVGGLLAVDGSPSVDAALWPCLARCTYDGSKITESIFDEPGPRGDYYEIILACIKENLGPLTESLYFVLPAKVKALLPALKRSADQ